MAYPSVPPPNDNPQNDTTKTRLIEKKQQQWKQENGNFEIFKYFS